MSLPNSAKSSSPFFLDGKLNIEIMEACRLPPSPYGQSDEFFVTFSLLKSLDEMKSSSPPVSSKIFPLNSTDLMCSDDIQLELKPQHKIVRLDLFYRIFSAPDTKADPILVGCFMCGVDELLSSASGAAQDVWCELRDPHQNSIKKGYIKTRNSFSGNGMLAGRKDANSRELLDGVYIVQSSELENVVLEPKLLHSHDSDTPEKSDTYKPTFAKPVELEVRLVADIPSSSAASLYSASIFSAVGESVPIFQESMLRTSRLVPMDSLEPRLLVPHITASTPIPQLSDLSDFSRDARMPALAGPYSTSSLSDEFVLERHSAAEDTAMSRLQAATVEGVLHA